MIHIELKQPYLSIKNLNSVELPDFTLLIGRNGVGKTQLLEAIAEGHISVSGISNSRTEKYDIDSFRPSDSGQANWESSSFAETAVEKYFKGESGLAETRVEIYLKGESGLAAATIFRNIYRKTTEDFELDDGTEYRLQFEEEARDTIAEMLSSSQPMRTLAESTDAIKYYLEQIGKLIFSWPLEDIDADLANQMCHLIHSAIISNRKLPHEITRGDILRAANSAVKTIGNSLSQVFTRYKVEQFSWAHKEAEAGPENFEHLMSSYLETNPPPWITLHENLEKMREAPGYPDLFNFEFSDPRDDKITFANHREYSFETKFTNRATGESYPVESLSSGEKILMSLCLASFNQKLGRQPPSLILLDELDSVLHPSMISALIASIKTLFIDKGTKVIMATHSVTTAALFDEDKIYRMRRNNNKITIRPITISEAVSELSEGLATIDTGLRIAGADAKPITILTEGKNLLHMKKWASLYYPEEVDVFDALPEKTGKDQLKTYGDLLSKVNTNSHFLIVWDCDAKSIAKNWRMNSLKQRM